MFSTVVFAAVFVGLLLAWVVLWALFLRFGLRWAKVPDVTTRRVVLATAIVIILQVAINVLFLFISPSSDAQSIVLGLVELTAAVIVPCAVISTVFKTRFLRAVQAWLPTILATIATLAFALLVLRPFLFEAFVVPTNAMAPTLVGQHWEGTCPECGRPNYCSPRDERYGIPDPPLMICDNFHVTEASDIDKTVHSGDRFMVAKFLTPRRWDLVVFQYPEEPTTLYVKRLVGLPGEKVHIQDGSVWVDGVRQTPPIFLRGIEYLSDLPDWFGPDLWGSINRPALLGNDEYFVLGDFSAQSKDSRLWEQGVPGHNPFAVPESHLKGVVTHTYWPPHRWRIHRWNRPRTQEGEITKR
jgi:signal peptidase I